MNSRLLKVNHFFRELTSASFLCRTNLVCHTYMRSNVSYGSNQRTTMFVSTQLALSIGAEQTFPQSSAAAACFFIFCAARGPPTWRQLATCFPRPTARFVLFLFLPSLLLLSNIFTHSDLSGNKHDRAG